MHRSSAASSRSLEKTSLISGAALPELLEGECERGRPAPVRRSVFSRDRDGFPAKPSLAASLGIPNGIHVGGAAFMNRCTMRLAFAGSGDFFGWSGPCGIANGRPRPTGLCLPELGGGGERTAPMPIPQRVSIGAYWIRIPIVH